MSNKSNAQCSFNESSETNHLQILFMSPLFCPYYFPFYIELRIALFAVERCAFLYTIENESCINSNYISETVLLLRTGHVSYFSTVFSLFFFFGAFYRDIYQHFHWLN